MAVTIKTYSGIYFDIENPTVDMINIEDIACALSKICRFTGQVGKFYSVCEHSYIVSDLVDKKYELHGLLHDASEAYLGDLSTPLKSLLPAYKKLEKRTMEVIGEKFGLDFYDTEAYNEVKRVDSLLRNIEGFHLQNWEVDQSGWPFWLKDKLPLIDHEEARRCFLVKYKQLAGVK